jgi:hypothetical protein
MATQDVCALCGRFLGYNGSKVYWTAARIRDIVPGFKGTTRMFRIHGIPVEKGAYVCRNRTVCEERLRAKEVAA